jgi:choline dehydrogenase-like flavoprotein
VISSGIGGLGIAALLANTAGQRVLVLELGSSRRTTVCALVG